jgi:hypothetical protein
LRLALSLQGRFDCRECTPDLKDYRGCTGQVPQVVHVCDAEAYHHCPIRDVRPASAARLSAYAFAQHGLWPEAGGMNRQPAKFLDAFLTIDEAVQEIREDMIDEPRRSKGNSQLPRRGNR